MAFMFFIEQYLGKFPQFVMYAMLECLMIIMLFIDGILSFVSNEFAKIFELRIPCLLCTRIDHVFVHRDKSFYYNESVCEIHKKDISSLAYCHMHKKLSDIRNMCEACLLSFATEKDSDSDGYKTLVGIMNKDVDSFVEDDNLKFEKGVTNKCCCCGETLKPKPQSKKYSRTDSMSNSHLQAPTPSPRAPWKNEEPKNMELPHLRFNKLKFVQDSKSEIPDDDSVSVADNLSREDLKAIATQLLPESDEPNTARTPTFSKGSKFFGISLSDSAHPSPRMRRKSTLDKIDFNPDAIDFGMNEVNGDSIVHHLTKQVKLDRKSLIDLYMELDEERNASAIAANNAMAMITRLQAEKAAVQMEALQYQRMMDEQAEYDQEALQILKDLVLKREEEIKILESELETFREKYGDIKKVGSEVCEIDDDDYQGSNFNNSQSLSSFGDKSEIDSPPPNALSNQENDNYFENSTKHEEGIEDGSSLDFERERSYLLGLLRDLENKMGNPGEGETSSSCSGDGKKVEQQESKTVLTREVSMIRERLRGIEASSGFLKHAAMTLQKGSEGAKLLMEIAEHLKELRNPIIISSKESLS